MRPARSGRKSGLEFSRVSKKKAREQECPRAGFQRNLNQLQGAHRFKAIVDAYVRHAGGRSAGLARSVPGEVDPEHIVVMRRILLSVEQVICLQDLIRIQLGGEQEIAGLGTDGRPLPKKAAEV